MSRLLRSRSLSPGLTASILGCWRACKTAQSWASRMAHLRADADRGFWAGLGAARGEEQGILASSLNIGKARRC